MKLRNMFMASTIALASFSATADDAGFTAAAKFGTSMNDAAGFDDAQTMGFNLGYDFGNWSVEFETLSGDFDFDGGSADMTTTALYGTYRSSGKGYFLAKIGMLNEKIEVGSYDVSDSGASYGLGGGYRLNDSVSLEAEYTIIESDVNFFGLGIRGKF